MKHLYLFLCLAVCSASTIAQTKPKTMDLGNIVSDSNSVSRDLGSKLGLASIHTSTNVIEIRLYSNVGFPGTQCTVLEYSKMWKATKYKLNAKDVPVRSVLKPSVGVESSAKAMLAMNVFALPSQKALSAGNYKLDLSTNEINPKAMIISDAPCYIIQFKVGDKSREYSYCDPKAYASFYKGQREFTDFANILKAFAKLEIK